MSIRTMKTGKLPVSLRRPIWLLVCLSGLCHAAQPVPQAIPRGFTQVKPVTGTNRSAPQELRLATGQFFSYALPQGWRVAEDGQFALTLLAPDSRALTVMVGNAGVPINYPPAQYVYEKLMAIQPQNLQLGPPRQVQPVAGFQRAMEYPVRYTINGVPCQGLATVHVAPAYDSAVMAVTAALSEAKQWPGYSTWLPLVAAQVSARNGAAFGARGVMQQNLQNSTAYARAAQEYRDWSQKNWKAVTDQREASNERNNTQFRESLGNVQTYDNPHDSRTPLELPNTWNYYWVNAQGTIVGTNDSRIDPNSGSTGDWRRMPKHQP